MSQKNWLSAIATFFGIVALMAAIPGVSHATLAAHRSTSRDQSPGIVIAENEQPGASADTDRDNDTDSKDSDDETADNDQSESNDQTDQQSAGNQQVAPQFQNGDNDPGEAGEDGQVPQMNAFPQQVNPYQ